MRIGSRARGAGCSGVRQGLPGNSHGRLCSSIRRRPTCATPTLAAPRESSRRRWRGSQPALAAYLVSPRGGIARLFIGGMFIHPAAILLSKLLGRPGAPARTIRSAPRDRDHRVDAARDSGRVPRPACSESEWFFVAMLLTIGGRYFTVRDAVRPARLLDLAARRSRLPRSDWLRSTRAHGTVALAGGVIELVFAGVVLRAALADNGRASTDCGWRRVPSAGNQECPHYPRPM